MATQVRVEPGCPLLRAWAYARVPGCSFSIITVPQGYIRLILPWCMALGKGRSRYLAGWSPFMAWHCASVPMLATRVWV